MHETEKCISSVIYCKKVDKYTFILHVLTENVG